MEVSEKESFIKSEKRSVLIFMIVGLALLAVTIIFYFVKGFSIILALTLGVGCVVTFLALCGIIAVGEMKKDKK